MNRATLNVKARWQAEPWAVRHGRALLDGPGGVYPFESSLLGMLIGWQNYAEDHRREYSSRIGDDGVLGPCWEEIGKSLIGLLNGRLGRLDGGTVDGFIRDCLTENGFDGDSA